MSDTESYSDDIDGSGLHVGTGSQQLHRPSSPTPPSTRTQNDSLDHAADQASLATRRRPHRRDRDRHSASRDFLKMLMNNEDSESKQARRFLRTALSKLETETQRAQEAERRALEIAARFKVVNEARLQAQQDLSRITEELRLYKVEYENARREIIRSKDIMTDLETQRDDAETVAARARTEAHKLREEKLAYIAREQGRLEGYEEGFQRGMEEARYERLRRSNNGDNASVDSMPNSRRHREQPLEELPVRNLPTPTSNGVALESPIPKHVIPPFSEQSLQEPASRFHEHGIGSTPSPANASLHHDSQAWHEGNEIPEYIRPTSMSDAPPSERHIPPDNWIPSADSNNYISVPPAFEMNPLSPGAPSQPLPVPPPGTVHMTRPPTEPPPARGYASSLDSVPASVSSTAISQFDIVTTPPGRLSVIRETSMEYSPETATHIVPEPNVFPSGSVEHGGGWGPQHGSEGTPRSRASSQRLADELRYGDPSVADGWRQDVLGSQSPEARSIQMRHHQRPLVLTTPAPLAPPQARPMSTTGVHPVTSPAPSGRSSLVPPPPPPPPFLMEPDPNMLAPPASRSQSATPSRRSSRSQSGRSHNSYDSSDIVVEVEPPSGTESSAHSPRAETVGMLSPNAPISPLPVQPPSRSQSRQSLVPTVPNSASMGHYPSMGSMFPVVPPGSMPGGMQAGLPAGAPVIPGSRPGTAPVGLPPGFVPASPNLPQMESTPRATFGSLPGNQDQRPRLRPADSASSVSTDSETSDPPGRHRRSRSESLRSKTPVAIVVKPPSSSSGSSKGGRPSLYSASPASGVQGSARPTNYPPAVPSAAFSPRSSNGGAPSGHFRSLSLDAGNTPGFPPRSLDATGAPRLRRSPSEASEGSTTSRRSSLRSAYGTYRPNEYVDPAFLASPALSPNTMANTMANAGNMSRPNIPSSLRPGGPSSPALSYVSLKR